MSSAPAGFSSRERWRPCEMFLLSLGHMEFLLDPDNHVHVDRTNGRIRCEALATFVHRRFFAGEDLRDGYGNRRPQRNVGSIQNRLTRLHLGAGKDLLLYDPSMFAELEKKEEQTRDKWSKEQITNCMDVFRRSGFCLSRLLDSGMSYGDFCDMFEVYRFTTLTRKGEKKADEEDSDSDDGANGAAAIPTRLCTSAPPENGRTKRTPTSAMYRSEGAVRQGTAGAARVCRLAFWNSDDDEDEGQHGAAAPAAPAAARSAAAVGGRQGPESSGGYRPREERPTRRRVDSSRMARTSSLNWSSSTLPGAGNTCRAPG